MADKDEYVEGLTGEEIINDVLEQVAARLRSNCNLRVTDSYTGGYEGTVDVHLKLHGFDLHDVKTSVPVSAPAIAGAETSGEADEGEEIDAQVDIALEPRLNLVRERSDQDIPSLGKDASGQVVIKKRRYVRSEKSKKA